MRCMVIDLEPGDMFWPSTVRIPTLWFLIAKFEALRGTIYTVLTPSGITTWHVNPTFTVTKVNR